MRRVSAALLLVASILCITASCKKKTGEAKPVAITAQPANNTSEVHLFGGGAIDQTHPGATEIGAGSGTYGGQPVNIRALLKFDLSSIPVGASIVSAKLSLFSNPEPLNGIDGHPNYGDDNAFVIERVTSDWNFADVNWSNQPDGDDEGAIEVPHTDAPELDVQVDVKELVANMVATGNYGFLLKLKTEQAYNFRIFCSSKNSNTEKHPKLQVVYK